MHIANNVYHAYALMKMSIDVTFSFLLYVSFLKLSRCTTSHPSNPVLHPPLTSLRQARTWSPSLPIELWWCSIFHYFKLLWKPAPCYKSWWYGDLGAISLSERKFPISKCYFPMFYTCQKHKITLYDWQGYKVGFTKGGMWPRNCAWSFLTPFLPPLECHLWLLTF